MCDVLNTTAQIAAMNSFLEEMKTSGNVIDYRVYSSDDSSICVEVKPMPVAKRIDLKMSLNGVTVTDVDGGKVDCNVRN